MDAIPSNDDIEVIEIAFSNVLHVLNQITKFLRANKFTLLGLVRLCDINQDSILERHEVENTLSKHCLPVTGMILMARIFNSECVLFYILFCQFFGIYVFILKTICE